MALQHPRHLNMSPVRLELRKQRKWVWSTCSGTKQTLKLLTTVNHLTFILVTIKNMWITVNYATLLLFNYNNQNCKDIDENEKLLAKNVETFTFMSIHVLCTICRDIKDTTVGTLSQRITNQVHGLKGLNSKLLDIRSYLERVAAGKLPINHQIIYQLQDVFNLLPDVNLLVSYL